ncbi:flagellar biosynthesis protein [Defluviimonas sp. WL0002]|uniref:Flagellar biosynthesis protein n=1 Tax=Albidovulum marisflavi TaxID=2984159 RepID=A0ABT2Z7H4_9RHOB|nr:flagellar biosynthesis protein [Defluviimonas sp. WL0002]MCV2867094.1 flagellar biosynthesis protein [Defluviimonas sp. WL0002]
MTRPLQLDSFDDTHEADARDVSVRELEEARLLAYETGFTAGWEDAVNAQESEIARLRADLGKSLREMSLTYADARDHVLRTIEPLLAEMVAKVLPRMAHDALGQVVLDLLRPEADKLLDAPVRLRAHPDNRKMIEEIAVRQAGFPVIFDPEPSLSLGQVHLAVGPSEIGVDLDRVIRQIGEAVTAFFHPGVSQEQSHG